MNGIVARPMRRAILASLMSGMIVLMPPLSDAVLGGIVILGSAGIMSVIVGAVSIMILPG